MRARVSAVDPTINDKGGRLVIASRSGSIEGGQGRVQLQCRRVVVVELVEFRGRRTWTANTLAGDGLVDEDVCVLCGDGGRGQLCPVVHWVSCLQLAVVAYEYCVGGAELLGG